MITERMLIILLQLPSLLARCDHYLDMIKQLRTTGVLVFAAVVRIDLLLTTFVVRMKHGLVITGAWVVVGDVLAPKACSRF